MIARRAAAALAMTLAVAALLTGCGAAAPDAPASSPGTAPAAVTSVAAAPVAAPTAVSIPAIAARSTLIRTGLNSDGTAAVPDVHQPQQASWADFTPEPGAPGPAVLFGHVNGGGRAGVFARLAELRPGDEVLVDRADGSTARFVIDRVDVVDKTRFPTAAVYGDTPDPQLRVITCGGELDRTAHRYLGQVIAYAHLAP